MAFKTFIAPSRPVRRFAIKSRPGMGKSTLLTQAVGPILWLDTDGRVSDVAHHAEPGKIIQPEIDPADYTDVRKIDLQLAKNMRGSGVKSIVVDSVTPIIQRIIRRVSLTEAAGEGPQNKGAAHREKADTMALLGECVSAYGTDTYWVWHTGTSQLGREVKETETVTQIEQDRLRRHLNAELVIVADKDDINIRGVLIEYSRNNPAAEGQIIWDTPENLKAGTFWKGMFERIDEALKPGKPAPAPHTAPIPPAPASPAPAAGAPAAETGTQPPAGTAPKAFANAEAAIAWGAQELQLNPEEAAVVYEEVKKKSGAKKPSAMWTAWIAEVESRKLALAGSF